MLTDFQNFWLLESVWNLLQNLYNDTHLILGMLLHYLGKLIQIFCIYLADMEEDANKLHFRCTDFNSSTHVTVYAECIYVFIKILSSSLNTMLIVDKQCSGVCCDEFSVPQLIAKVNK